LLLKNTAIYIFILVIINFLVPFIMAFINHFVLKHGKKVYKVIIFMPSLISLVVGAMLIQWLFNPIIGPVSKLIVLFGATMPTWSKTPGLVIFVISLVACYKAFGYNFLVLLSGVSNVSNDLIEEAHLEKASNFTIFTKIVMPLTSSTAIYVLIMSIVQGVQFVFTPIKILTQGGPNDASSNILYGTYQEAFLYFNPGLASVLSVITMLIFIVLLILEFKYVEKGVYYEN
jgi:sn-glycerol 3-phosphate transport system permease protein